MDTTLYVISDLHLGGAPDGDGSKGFQICSPASQDLLTNFINQLADQAKDRDIRLVLAGDIVDFLAEEPFEAFTSDPNSALEKFQRILNSTCNVWDALAAFVSQRRGSLTLMLGNHDIELSFPTVRQRLLDRLGPGRVDFIYDNQAFVLGPVLVEHGNRYDEWNAVPHNALRRARSQLSRASTPKPQFPAMPGSRLVVDVLNPLKKRYSFIDLLKPEDAAALPIAAALGATNIRAIWKSFQYYRQIWSSDFDENREPLDPEFISAADQYDQAMCDLAQDIASGGDGSQLSSATGIVSKAKHILTQAARNATQDLLFRALRGTSLKHRAAYAVGTELEKYLRPVRQHIKSGFMVVVYGHTHHVKRIQFGSSTDHMPVYLNTGTWADLMRVPQALWASDEDFARQSLTAFLADIESNKLEGWRRQLPTYAKIEINGGRVEDADVFFADATHERVTDNGIQRRLNRDVRLE